MERRCARRWIIGCLLAVAVSHRGGGQSVRTTVDLGATRVRYEDSSTSTAVSLSPSAALLWSHGSLGAWGSGAQLSGSNWTLSGGMDGALRTPAVHAMTAEVAAFGGASTRRDGRHTAEYRSVLRGRLQNDDAGASVGGGVGQTWDGVEWRSLAFGEGMAWLVRAPWAAQLDVVPTTIRRGARFTDAGAEVVFRQGRVEFSGSVGLRRGQMDSLIDQSRQWGSVDATIWMTPAIGFVMAGGTYPASPTQALPGGRYIFAAIRLASLRSFGERSAASTQRVAVHDSALIDTVPTLVWQRTSESHYLFRVRASSAHRVELMSDLTQWRPVALVTDGGAWWHVSMPVSSGAHQVNVRIDGGAWIVPHGTLSVDDELGGVVGLFEIP